MAGYNDSEGPYTGGAPGFFTHLTHLTDITNKFDKDATPATGDTLTWNGSVYAPASAVFNVEGLSAAAVQAVLDVAPAGSHIVFEGAYALTASLVIQADNQWIDARGASFTMTTWATPVFDAINRNGCTFDVGTVTFTGTRGGVAGTIRGENGYTSGCAVWINGDRNNVRSGRIIDMPCGAACFSSWNGSVIYGTQHVGNRLGVGGDIEVSGYDFGVLTLWQKDFVIGNLYGHDDIDDSAGANPTHVYYISSDSTHRSSGLTIINARGVNNTVGQPFQIKYNDQVTLVNHSADSSKGLANFQDCDDLTIGTLLGTNCANAGGGSLTLQHVTAPCKRLRADTISIQLATNNDERAASIWADDAEITNLAVEASHSVSVNTALNLVVLRGSRGRIKSSILRSTGAGHMRGFIAGFSATTVSNWTIDDPIVRGPRAVVDVIAGSTAVKVRYDSRIQTLTGTATQVSIIGTPVGGELFIEDAAIAAVPFMSSVGNNPAVAMLANGSNVMSSANQALLVEFIPPRNVTVSSLRWVTAATASGNYDIGIYSVTGTRLWAKGSTAWPATSTAIVETVSPTVALIGGTTYYLVLAADNTTGTWRGTGETIQNTALMLDGSDQFCKSVLSSFPLPSSLTPGNTRSGRCPLIIVHGT